MKTGVSLFDLYVLYVLVASLIVKIVSREVRIITGGIYMQIYTCKGYSVSYTRAVNITDRISKDIFPK